MDKTQVLDFLESKIENVVEELSKEWEQAKNKPTAERYLSFIMAATHDLVVFAEEATEGVRNIGVDKKQFVLDAIERIYVRTGINVPYVPDWIEKKILRMVVSAAIDFICAKMLKGFVSNTLPNLLKYIPVRS